MDHSQFTQAKQNLLSVANIVSPTGIEQRAFVAMCRDMDGEGLESRDYLRRLTGAIYDGLAYGNWPRGWRVR